MSKRKTRHLLAAAFLGISLTSFATLSQGTLASEARELSFYHTHTGKRLNVVYWQDGVYDDTAPDENEGNDVEGDSTLIPWLG